MTHKIELRFKSKEAKEKFLGGLSDGFGENYCVLTPPQGVKSLSSADWVTVENAEDDDETED